VSSEPSSDPQMEVRAGQILRRRGVWIAPLALGAVFVALMSVIYIGSVVNPTGHVHGLPVMVVDEDTGAVAHGQKVDIGHQMVEAMLGSAAVTQRLKLQVTTLAQARNTMNRAGAYATLVIPATLSRSALVEAGALASTHGVPADATVTLEENSRLGSIGVSLAAGVMTPTVAKISALLRSKLVPVTSDAAKANPVNAAALSDPVSLTTATYRPLPDHSALGLSAFYAALLAIMSGFIGGTLINSSIDSALGYASTELGPRRQQRRPVRINRRRTLIVKWCVALVAAPILTGILLLVSVGLLNMRAPDVLLLWLLLGFASLMIATGTLALLAAFGAIGQLLAMILLVYLSLASSGGTIPIQALPGVFKVVGQVEPLRQVLDGSRAILYFGARGDAGLTHSLVMVGAELIFWLLLGLAFTAWYDHRKLYRIAPDMLGFIERSIDRRTAELSQRTDAPGADVSAAGP
jgi:YhgE/Pip-like protein